MRKLGGGGWLDIYPACFFCPCIKLFGRVVGRGTEGFARCGDRMVDVY